MEQNSNILLIIKLLQETTTLSTISDFLKEKGLHYSASSWSQLQSERIIPALNEHKISTTDLINLLQTTEEYGRQHVFLYKCLDDEKIFELLNEQRVNDILERTGLSDILNEPKILDQPESPTIVDIRFERNEGGFLTKLIIKIIEARVSQKFIKDQFNEDGTLSKIYKPTSERIVNVVKFYSNGNLELCIASQESKSYKDNVNGIWNLINDIIPRSYFSDFYLNKAKDRLWIDRHELNDLIRFSNSTLRNDNGTALKAASGSKDSNLFDDNGANDSMETFYNYEGYCEAHNVWFRAKENEPIPTRDIHVLLSGELNEFAITPNSSEGNYEYVINQLRRLNN